MPRIRFLKDLWGYRAGDVTDFNGDDAMVARFAESGHLTIVAPETPRRQTVAVKSMATGQIVDRMIEDAPNKAPAVEAARAGRRRK